MNSPISLVGPIDLDGSMGSAQEFDLYNIDSSRFNTNTQTNNESIPGFDSEDSISTPLTGSVSRSINGRGSPLAIHMGVNEGEVTESLRRWLYGFEALVLPEQGLGYDIESSVRGGDYDPRVGDSGFLVSTVRWSLTSRNISRFDWNIDLELSEGVQSVSRTPDDYISEQLDQNVTVDKVEVDGLTLEFDEVDERSVSRSVDINTVDLMHQFDIPLTGVIETGVETDVEFSGRVLNEDATDLAQTVRDFDQELQGKEATVFDSFSGRSFTGTISRSSSDFSAGQPKAFDFSLDLEVTRTFGVS